MTVAQNHGNKAILIPLLIAGMIILIILAVGSGKQQYAIPVDDFDFERQEGDMMVRLDGIARDVTDREDGGRLFNLCSAMKCIPMDVPRGVGTDFKAGDGLVVTGVSKNHTIHVIRILRRCHGQGL